jgi:hypothetical protein
MLVDDEQAMGTMNPRIYDDVTVCEYRGGRLSLGGRHTVADPGVGVVAGRVFFDHVRGARFLPEPSTSREAFALVMFWQDFDWTQQHRTTLTWFDDAAALIARATIAVADERAGGSSDRELWEVYGVVVDERRRAG